MRRRRSLLPVVSVVTFMFGAIAVAFVGGFRLNLTPSEPLGLWRIQPLHRTVSAGDLVFVCPPITALFEEARHRGYLRHGLCPGGVAPLIKTVAAVPGQRVEIGAGVVIDGRKLPASNLRATDGEGRAIRPYAGGLVPAAHLFLHSSYASSYDSRYFGPVPDSGLLGLARPVLTFNP
ncbi:MULTISPECIES: conjugative transfer signal peptidase TraF [Rhizobium/Agrobacterium group]|uniref:Conjugal transfer protein TraF n=1 Tax=Agrobacterium genomosp. 2 str. CFBP 5494 TaxID=1183436 RepID=A0A9W5F3Q6_9HYPH|nr:MULTISPECIES: conjugative transfer signal peptidase TraF [Rhizobium/Agrobacterium group]RSC21378.1 conjugative transfer signal peptidase TraF [Agrobacterium sp. FDAARGOS_525]CAD7054510.1 conjugative transfer signal peptidase TraF [Rhizobium sp. P007]CUX03229.1 Conjugal transfer protein TraF [Agrobacterium genomosp. 2 str. CFBP 5494]